jgi:hypothetical protein
MKTIEEIEQELKNFAGETQQANKDLAGRLATITELTGEYNRLASQATATDRQKINIGKYGNLLTRLGELTKETDAACERVTGGQLL